MKKTESIEKDALTEMMSPSVSPSAASDAEVKKSVEMALQDFTPKNRIADSVIDEEAVAETQSIMEVSTAIEEPPTIQRRVSSKQRKLSLEEYRNAYLKVPVIIDRKPVFVSCEVRDRLEDYVRKLGGRKMSVSGLLENIARQHLDTYDADFEQWRKKLRHRSKNANRTLAEYIRDAAFDARIVAKHSTEDVAIIRNLTGMANNLNQLTKLSHQTGFYRTKNIVMEVFEKLKSIMSDYKATERRCR